MKIKEPKKKAEEIDNETNPNYKSAWKKGLSKRKLGKSFWGDRSGLYSSRRTSGLWSGGLS
ncbi:MAG: hypothetical protein ACI92G_000784 [Candidatus Pelagisphaera sp.]|jgi:hypothetical protein